MEEGDIAREGWMGEIVLGGGDDLSDGDSKPGLACWSE